MSDSSALVVEDETMILLDIEADLKEAGFHVLGVASATFAIQAFDADPTSFKALISDIRLGAGESRREVARHVRQADPTLPVIYISARSIGAEGVPESVIIAKPFAMAQVITALSRS